MGPHKSGNSTPKSNPRVGDVRELVIVFKPERTVYLAVTAVSAVTLLTTAAVVIYHNHGDPATLTLLFGSSGLIGYSANRVLRMWSDAMRYVMTSRTAGAENE